MCEFGFVFSLSSNTKGTQFLSELLKLEDFVLHHSTCLSCFSAFFLLIAIIMKGKNTSIHSLMLSWYLSFVAVLQFLLHICSLNLRIFQGKEVFLCICNVVFSLLWSIELVISCYNLIRRLKNMWILFKSNLPCSILVLLFYWTLE